MCYYNGQKLTRAEYIHLLDLEKAIAAFNFLDSDLFNGFDYPMVATIKPRKDERNFDVVQMEWGFIPPYPKTREDVVKMRNGYTDAHGKFHIPYTMLNAQGEELLLPGKVFRQAALERRCLVLSSGFYDWRHVHGKNKRTGEPLKTATKYPYRVGVKDSEYFYMAGVWQPWTDQQTGEYIETVAIVTTKPPKGHLMAQVHNSKERMPTILPDDLAFEWIMEELSEDRITELANYVIPSIQIDAYTIHKDFRNRIDPIAAFEYEELPAIDV